MAHKTAGELQAYGAEASRAFNQGEYPTLTQAVVGTVKTAALTPMQVQRVVEQANKLAYLQVHESKLGEEQRIIEFNGGPARTHEVLAQLNSTPSPHLTVDYSDYHSAPAKTASSPEETARYFENLFGNSPSIPSDQQLDPLGDCRKLAGELGDLLKQADSQRSFAFSDLSWAERELCDAVKTARADQIPLGYIAHAWASLSPPEGLLKLAMQKVTEHLADTGNLTKIAQEIHQLPPAGSQFDTSHPIFTAFTKYASTLIEYRALEKVADDLQEQLGALRGTMKLAEQGLTAPHPPLPPHAPDPSETKTASLAQLQEQLEQDGLMSKQASLRETVAENAGGYIGHLSRGGAGAVLGVLRAAAILDKIHPEAFRRGGTAALESESVPKAALAVGAPMLAGAGLVGGAGYALGKHQGRKEGVKEGAAEVHPDPFPADTRGIISKVRDAVKATGDQVGRGAGWVASHLADKGSSAPARVARGVSTAVQAIPVLGGAAVGLKGLQHLRAAGDSPAGRFVKSFIPGTDAHAEDEMRTQMMYGAQPPMGYY